MKSFGFLTLVLAISIFAENNLSITANANETKQKKTETRIVAEITASSVNVRSAANTKSEALCQLTRGEKVIVISIENEWAKIEAPNSARVWVEANAIVRGKVVKNAKVFAGPSVVYEELGNLKIGESVKIILGSEKWIRIAPNKSIHAWISTSFIKFPEVPVTSKGVVKISEQIALGDRKQNEMDTEGKKLLDFPNKEVIAKLTPGDKEYYFEQKIATERGLQLVTGTVSHLKEHVKGLATHAIGIRVNERYYTICYLRSSGMEIKLDDYVNKNVSIQGKTEQITGWKRPILVVEKIREISEEPKLTLTKKNKVKTEKSTIVGKDIKTNEIIANDEGAKINEPQN